MTLRCCVRCIVVRSFRSCDERLLRCGSVMRNWWERQAEVDMKNELNILQELNLFWVFHRACLLTGCESCYATNVELLFLLCLLKLNVDSWAFCSTIAYISRSYKTFVEIFASCCWCLNWICCKSVRSPLDCILKGTSYKVKVKTSLVLYFCRCQSNFQSLFYTALLKNNVHWTDP